jgi:DNA methylase N-4/N-6
LCEIGKERIRRAGEKVKAECADAERAAALDVGFKVFKLDSSNLQKWQPQLEDLMASLEASMDNFLPDRTALDVVYEIALKLGLDLSYEVEERKVDGHTVYVIGAGALMICLDSQISMDTAEALLRLHEEYEPETWQVVFRDTGFLSDQEKTNIKETLKSAGLDEDAFISI